MFDAHDPPPKLVIEVCIDSVESAVAAVRGGANRLELCANLGYGGGTTPSIGLLLAVKKVAPNVPVMAMVRSRTGDFVYSEEELSVMLHDIAAFKAYGVQGVVFGALTPEGEICENQVRRLISAALPLEVCFHRAFDMTSNLKNAWKTLSKMTGITRILTSGFPDTKRLYVASGGCRHASATEALEILAWMLDSTGTTPIGVLPGSGINISTIPELCKTLLPHGLKEIHLSGGRWVDGRSAHRPDGMGMGDWGIWRTDEESVRKVRDFVDVS